MFELKNTDLFELEEEDFDTVLATDIVFTGEIRFAKPFMIKGSVSGLITATSDLVVDTNAKVVADITAERVLVRGSVEGNIDGKQLVFVASTGSVTGDICSAQVVLEPGSSFSGKCTMVK
ncbi:bactofilin family protein [Treponema brennaborense]|uniref:Polymer-forming cytoskeletal protein n=1 Tax=Treponema brennaborense (strain DSM 12168 / CIP 105900 / DD5/3) TaxID=906968 RepID=F4LQF8_TREBD|nr:polymer-forming cytoskeletal protein [Treponema brennaborense]AEE17167.1 protein of unknown function DUF583 [Treponema brennaborense DSM 12168]